MAAHSSILAWRIPSTEEPGSGGERGYSLWGRKELDTTERLTLSFFQHRRTYSLAHRLDRLYTSLLGEFLVTARPFLY